jgi:glycine/D-amino acid oxidase-like deaminating enzyme
MFVAEELLAYQEIPLKYHSLYTVISQARVLSLLETNDSRYVAALSGRKGCMNSALFTEEMAGYLLLQYADRFTLAEHAKVFRVVLSEDKAVLQTAEYLVTASRVVLCTNGFENITIVNKVGVDIDTKFHHLVEGKIGYMAAYLEPIDKKPTAISYYSKATTDSEEPYYYVTRRPFEKEKDEHHNLVSVGGPEISLRDKAVYHKDHPYPEYAEREIDAFVHATYRDVPKRKIEYTYHWHGLMGYTPNRLRLIGAEPRNPVLLYNLGCNGVGILPSIYGGHRLGEIFAGREVHKSIFDPREASALQHNA